MAETVLAEDAGSGHTLVEWRAPDGARVEWALVAEGVAEVLFSWSGRPGKNLQHEPFLRVNPHRADFALVRGVRALEKLTLRWPDADLSGRWFEVCRGWDNQGTWAADNWKQTLVKRMFPWLSAIDPWLAWRMFWVYRELQPLFQYPGAREGLKACGISVVGPKLLNLVLKSSARFIESEYQAVDELLPVLWAVRLAPWMSLDELYRLWDWESPEFSDPVASLERRHPGMAKELGLRFVNSPRPGAVCDLLEQHWASQKLLVIEEPTPPWLPLPVTPGTLGAPILWPNEVTTRFERTLGPWSLRLPRSTTQVRQWGERLANCLRKAGTEEGWFPEDSVVAGLFDGRELVAVGEWDTAGNVVQCEGFSNGLLSPKHRTILMTLLGTDDTLNLIPE